MFITVGLGNPGPEYQATRHNAGRMAVDRWAQQLSLGWQTKSPQSADWAKSPDLLLVRPHTFMNESGRAVQAATNYFFDSPKEHYQQLIVLHDDLDLELGQFKFVMGSGPKQHNGLLSVYQELGTDQFWHGRIGVDSRSGDRTLPGKSYVLQKFTDSELVRVQNSIDALISHITQTIQHA